MEKSKTTNIEKLKFNRRTKRDYAYKIIDKYERGIINKETVYNHFWKLFKCPTCKYETSQKTWKNKIDL